MAQERKVGDFVQHLTGGPKMVIKTIEPDGVLTCSWMIKGNKHEDNFTADELKDFEAPKVGVFWLGKE